MTTPQQSKLKKRKKTRKNGKISFDEECVRKSVAEQLVSKELDYDQSSHIEKIECAKKIDKFVSKGKVQKYSEEIILNDSKHETMQGKPLDKKRKCKKRKMQNFSEPHQSVLSESFSVKQRKDNIKTDTKDLNVVEMTESETIQSPVKKVESNRERKRKKHDKLLEDKKLQSELLNQQNCLNYLSSWKHNKDDWKFKKLRQVWLQQNIFNSNKIPDFVWNILIEYFANSKGKIRQSIIDSALKVIEAAECKDGEDIENIKLERARSIIQNLQE